MTVAITQAKRSAARARWHARRRATRRRRWRRTPPGRSCRRSSSFRRARSPAASSPQTIAYGARTLFVRGDFDECLALARSASAELGIQLLNSVNPFRIEGQKTIVFELLEQLGWNAPDWIALPAGNLGNTSAFGKALRDARDAGLIDRVPRLCAVQAEGAAPFARSFEHGFDRAHHASNPKRSPRRSASAHRRRGIVPCAPFATRTAS